jgi:hypothetical protein
VPTSKQKEVTLKNVASSVFYLKTIPTVYSSPRSAATARYASRKS